MKEGTLRLTGVATLLLAAGYLSGTTSASEPPREGLFPKSPMQMATCSMAQMMKVHPEMFFQLGADEKTFSVSGAPTKTAALYWKLSAEDVGSGKSTVTLQESGASAAELDEVWRVVEDCGRA